MSVLENARWLGPDFKQTPSLVVDSRYVQPGDIFVAIRGRSLDGHDFIADALTRGAAGIIVEKMDHAVSDAVTVLCVDNALQALSTVAHAWRMQMKYPIVGITGSVGKTTTKELLGVIAQHAGKKALVSQGNQNTVLGLSMNMWRLRQDYDAAFFELGISKKGEMERMAALLQPTYGVITTIGHSHMLGLGNCADIALEKRALFTYFTQHSIGVIQGDTPVLVDAAYPHAVIKFGKKTTNQVQARKITVSQGGITCTLKLYHEKVAITVPTTNTAYINCMLAAAAVASLLKIPLAVIARAVQQPPVVAGRYEKKVLPAQAGILIHDAYNASPESMKAALLAFEQIPATTKVAILGDMLELGQVTAFWHRQMGRFLKKVPSLTHLILVGSHVQALQETAPDGLVCVVVPAWQEAVAQIKPLLGASTAVLVKASRGIGLNNLVYELEMGAQ